MLLHWTEIQNSELKGGKLIPKNHIWSEFREDPISLAHFVQFGQLKPRQEKRLDQIYKAHHDTFRLEIKGFNVQVSTFQLRFSVISMILTLSTTIH